MQKKPKMWLESFLTTLAIVLSFTSGAAAQVDLSPLPPTSADRAEPTPHFPTRMAAYVWRNWNLVDLEKLARTVDATPEELIEVADALGLPKYEAPKWAPERAYITVTRRNWSILPYEQLLTLLGFTPSEFAEKLREDDFLSVKLGAKPLCDPLTYAKPSAEELEAYRELAKKVEDAVSESVAALFARPNDYLFRFLDDLDGPAESSKVAAGAASQFEICYLHSYFAVFGDPLLQDSSLLYPDKLLAKLQERGVNGVWLHSLLRDLAPPTEDFPEFGAKSEIRRAALRDLVNRAKRYGIDVYLYMNEPRAMPAEFFNAHPEEKGVVEGQYCALCASSPKVRKWLTDSLAYLFEDVPGLGGIFTITGSENLTTCVSHGRFADCPRCKKHNDVELLVDLNAAMEEGVHRTAPDAKVIVWDWGWRGHGMAEDVIAALPKNVWLQTVSEWALPLKRGGVDTTVGEYSISAVGPGPRAKAHWAAAKKAGLKTIAKCQFNTTWEAGSVPAVPAMDLIAQHAHALSRSGVDGVMAGWSLGGYPSMNLEIVHEFATDPNAEIDAVLNKLAKRYYGVEGAELARKGWSTISTAFQEFPYGGSVVYNAPNLIGPMNLLRSNPTRRPATMVGIPYDDLDAWRGSYPAEIFAEQMRKCGDGFLLGAQDLEKASKYLNTEEARSQTLYAKALGIIYQSCANQTRFILARNERIALQEELNTGANAELEARLKNADQTMLEIAKAELKLANALRVLQLQDGKIGFESTNQYWFAANDAVEKIVSCLDIIEKLEAELAK